MSEPIQPCPVLLPQLREGQAAIEAARIERKWDEVDLMEGGTLKAA